MKDTKKGWLVGKGRGNGMTVFRGKKKKGKGWGKKYHGCRWGALLMPDPPLHGKGR